MINSLLMGEMIYNRLSANSALAEYVGERIYPLVVDEDVKFPFVVFYRNSISSNTSKGGIYEDVVSYSVVVVSEKYAESCYIANEVRKTLEVKKLQAQDLTIYDSRLTNVAENFIANSYVQTLTFQCAVH